jgi:hypothetical protein
MNYSPPSIASRQPIAEPLVLGATYTNSPTWTDQPDERDRDR